MCVQWASCIARLSKSGESECTLKRWTLHRLRFLLISPFDFRRGDRLAADRLASFGMTFKSAYCTGPLNGGMAWRPSYVRGGERNEMKRNETKRNAMSRVSRVSRSRVSRILHAISWARPAKCLAARTGGAPPPSVFLTCTLNFLFHDALCKSLTTRLLLAFFVSDYCYRNCNFLRFEKLCFNVETLILLFIYRSFYEIFYFIASFFSIFNFVSQRSEFFI